ncbi:LysR family transcriptional regulator [Rubellimicrobium roseum]|uniref:LysR family transcriptional regulator n=1 Tax=Rubellimicrobium roseum TaxID=687525 RepID=A0A5C4NHY9_9RHOB|nr:LysR family transcriptional regulator [Rubellimicrobium roseum]TNC73058.1 LysR family transcriptional regulator [Rubellimicrobium roseum]
MPRNLDLTALRSFVTVADTGGVTRAAGLLNLTQSAVSMQLKRLEDSTGLALIDRSGRGVALTPMGEQLLSYARRMLALNDEAWGRLTRSDLEGEITLGVPHDIVYPAIPRVLQRFAAEYPKVKVNLLSSFTLRLQEEFAKGEIDVILTTEDAPAAECLGERSLTWIGAPGGQAWRGRPLRLALESQCIFRKGVQRRLDREGIPWEAAVEGSSTRTNEAIVSADLAVFVQIDGAQAPHLERVAHGGLLPDLWSVHINLYAREPARIAAQEDLVELIRRELRSSSGSKARPGVETFAETLA